MGTCDELALDALLNALMGFSRDLAGLKRIVVSGRHRLQLSPMQHKPGLASRPLQP